MYFPYHDPNKITDGAREKLHSISLTMLEGLGVDLPVKFIHQPTMIEKRCYQTNENSHRIAGAA